MKGKPYLPAQPASEDWTTPPEIVDMARKVLRGIDLDPCGNINSIVGAKRQVWLPKWAENLYPLPPSVIVGDGLLVPWRGTVFVNPPYDAKTMGAFMRKAVDSLPAATSLFLVQAKTGIACWQDYVSRAQAVCFWRGRIVFGGVTQPAPFASALVLWTPFSSVIQRFTAVFGQRGQVWTR